MSAVGGLAEGPLHKDGGIPLTVKSTGQKIEIEGGEIILNRKNVASEKKLRVTGTPKQIASAINELDGNGVKIADGAKVEKLKKGGLIKDSDFDIFNILFLI